jgi:hypothetical protein
MRIIAAVRPLYLLSLTSLLLLSLPHASLARAWKVNTAGTGDAPSTAQSGHREAPGEPSEKDSGNSIDQ